jgi:hypothetical protein
MILEEQIQINYENLLSLKNIANNLSSLNCKVNNVAIKSVKT